MKPGQRVDDHSAGDRDYSDPLTAEPAAGVVYLDSIKVPHRAIGEVVSHRASPATASILRRTLAQQNLDLSWRDPQAAQIFHDRSMKRLLNR